MKKSVLHKIIRLMVLTTVLSIFTTACGQKGLSENPKTSGSHPVVEIVMADDSKMTLELYPEYAPETVANFISLAKSGFYDGLKFHRIAAGFMIQGGDPAGNGSGGSDKTIKGEFASNGFKQNTLKHTKGVISMARSGDPDSAGSQFFIMDGDGPHLDGDYAAFGKLTEGEKTLNAIAATPVTENPGMRGEMSLPTKDVIIKKVNVVSE